MSTASIVHLGIYELDTDNRRLRAGDKEVEISPLATRMLQLMASRQGQVVGRRELIAALWADNSLVGEPALNRLVSETRACARKISDVPLVETIQKSGYRIQSLPPAPVVATGKVAPSIPDSHVPAVTRSALIWGFALFALCIALFAAVMAHDWMEAAIGLKWMMPGPG